MPLQKDEFSTSFNSFSWQTRYKYINDTLKICFEVPFLRAVCSFKVKHCPLSWTPLFPQTSVFCRQGRRVVKCLGYVFSRGMDVDGLNWSAHNSPLIKHCGSVGHVYTRSRSDWVCNGKENVSTYQSRACREMVLCCLCTKNPKPRFMKLPRGRASEHARHRSGWTISGGLFSSPQLQFTTVI